MLLKLDCSPIVLKLEFNSDINAQKKNPKYRFSPQLVSLTSEVLEHAKKLQWVEGNTMQMKKLGMR